VKAATDWSPAKVTFSPTSPTADALDEEVPALASLASLASFPSLVSLVSLASLTADVLEEEVGLHTSFPSDSYNASQPCSDTVTSLLVIITLYFA
jgi:hypothetical protein